jgi:hypothetical protein
MPVSHLARTRSPPHSAEGLKEKRISRKGRKKRKGEKVSQEVEYQFVPIPWKPCTFSLRLDKLEHLCYLSLRLCVLVRVFQIHTTSLLGPRGGTDGKKQNHPQRPEC